MQNLPFSEIIYVIGAIITLATFYGIVTKPYKSLEERITSQEQNINELSNEIKAQQKLLNSSLKVQLLVLQHIIYGNHTDTLKAELTKLQSTIVDTNT